LLADPDDTVDLAEREILEDDAAVAGWRWPDFTPRDMTCLGTGKVLVDCAFMDRLQALRSEYGKLVQVLSGYRTPEYNKRVSGTGKRGPHTTGRAVDVAARGREAFALVALAFKHGFTGVGVCQRGQGLKYVHLDDLPACSPDDESVVFPRPFLWSY
jgi:hypothetical protein